MNSYPESIYKESHIDWIGQVPDSWNFFRSKFIFGNKSIKKNDDESLLSVTQSDGVVLRETSDLRVWNPGEDVSMYKLIESGDFVISLRSFEGGIELSNIRGLVSPAYTVLNSIKKIDNRFFRLLMKSHQFIIELNKNVTGIRQGKTISWDDFSEIYLPFPPLHEQILISKFLDKKTSQIDSLIEKTQRKILLLKEQRTSLINQCVTKGLDPNVEIKDSGIEWIGEIPKHWDVKQIKHIKSDEKYSLVDGPFGSDLKSEHFVDDGTVIVIESGFVTKGSFIQSRPFKKISNNHFEKVKRSQCKTGDIIIAKIGEYYGMSSVLPELNSDCVISGNSCKLTVSKFINRDYVHQTLLWLRSTGVIQREVNQTGQPFISLGVINNLNILVPPKNEQDKIMKYLEDRFTNIDDLSFKETQRINLLKEYRQSLISNVVTGKVRVTEDMI